VSDAGTPSNGEGGGVVPASWDREHGSSQVQAQENIGQPLHMQRLPMQRGRHHRHRPDKQVPPTQVQGGDLRYKGPPARGKVSQ
jgi:hypothetical protein